MIPLETSYAKQEQVFDGAMLELISFLFLGVFFTKLLFDIAVDFEFSCRTISVLVILLIYISIILGIMAFYMVTHGLFFDKKIITFKKYIGT